MVDEHQQLPVTAQIVEHSPQRGLVVANEPLRNSVLGNNGIGGDRETLRTINNGRFGILHSKQFDQTSTPVMSWNDRLQLIITFVGYAVR
ncbi:hypothetical protein [Rhodococcoides fascians]|uniref:hypothetical protein n=1 Tax=Rhodococcoides fascians TaxID=1828 RepID=UPI000AFE5CAC